MDFVTPSKSKHTIIRKRGNGGDVMKLYLDPGHGGTDSGAQGNGLNEKDITLKIAQKIQGILTNKYENITVKLSRTSDISKSLSQRTNEANAWGADFYLSIHINAADSAAAQGYEDYIYSGLSSTSRSATYQNIIHQEVMKVNGLTDRGQKTANFHVLRESSMNALLSENGFITNTHDAALMKQASWLENVAQGHVNGLAKAFNLKLKSAPVPSKPSNPVPGTLFKVIASSFKLKKNADERIAFLHGKGIESFIKTTIISGETWYRVQAGAFTTRENAEIRLAEVKKAGIKDAFIVAENDLASAGNAAGGNTPPPKSGNNSGNDEPAKSGNDGNDVPATSGNDGNNSTPPPIITPDLTIFGSTYLTPEQMNQFVKKFNPSAPELGSFYQKFGTAYGIRGDVAFAQAILETNYFRFTGDVGPGQNNFAGIGATGSGQRGASFETQETGVLAHFQHLYAYTSTKALPGPYPLVDPRFHLVDRGSAPTWISLNGHWAVPGNNYGQSILNLFEKMINPVN
jgi:N-acetylmuramoyl-L-alanine amidase